ncbi:MAG: alpha/beta hydrolase [Lachnospiraceae bacterium]|nr:alpha/beta hydrolase [Lachnospiraceae bacterium]
MYLKTKEANLYYEVQGAGKPILLIHGVVVDAGLYEHAARLLAPYYQVITYDRRGNSRSGEVYVEEYDISAQVRDAEALLEHLGIQRVFLAGTSAGAIVAQELMKARPALVSHLLMYEPPLVSLLEHQEEEQAWIARMEETISRGRINTAMLEFMKSLGEVDDRREEKSEEEAFREMRNFQHFMQQEFSVFLHYHPELSWFAGMCGKITVAIGERSGPSKYARAAQAFQEKIGCELLHFPGCHNLPGDLPADYVNSLMGVLARKGW